MKHCLLLLLSVAGVFAADTGHFAPLFNGRDLSGWVNANCAPETWSVTNGMIHCTGRPTGAIRTERQYENFILEVEWRHLSSGGNSGVFIWGTPIAAPGVPFLRGIEVQVLDEGYNVKGKNEWYTTHGDVFPIHGATMKPFGRHNGQRSFPSQERSKASPEWNHYRIVCANGVIRLSVNGAEVSGGEECNYRKGYLALESEGAPVEFRNIRIQELPSSNASPELTAPQDEGFRAIFTGLDLRGWKGSADWSVEGERIRGKKADAPLVTEKEYGDAEFIFDIRVSKDANEKPRVLIRGVPWELRGYKPDQYTRYRVTCKGTEAMVNATDNFQEETAQKVVIPESAPKRAPFGFRAGSGSVEIFNTYARE